jgi:class 3 adenylate cyclase
VLAAQTPAGKYLTLARITEPGPSILVSSTVRDLVGSMDAVQFGPSRNVTLKGLDGTHPVFDVDWQDSVVSTGS